MHHAAKHFPGALNIFFNKGVDDNFIDRHGVTILHELVEAHVGSISKSDGIEEWIKFIVARGVDVNATDKDGKTPLHIAAFFRSDRVVVCLMSLGANINATDNQGHTPLYEAVLSVNLNFPDDQEHTPWLDDTLLLEHEFTFTIHL